MSISDLYSDEGIFGNFTYSGPGVSRGLILSMCLMANFFWQIKGKVKILVVGAGAGYEVVNYIKGGHYVKAIDLFAPKIPMVREVTTIGSAVDMPFEDKEFDIVHCTEMLEHVPEEETEKILLECKRVSKKFMFSIATRDDPPYHTHINIHPEWWWTKKFNELGFNIERSQYAAKGHIIINNVATFFSWVDGVLIHGEC